MKRDQSSKRVTRSMSKTIKDEGEVDDPRKALFAAIQSRGDPEKKKDVSPPPDPRQALFAAIKNKNKEGGATSDKDGDTLPSDVTYTPGVHRLQKFLNHSKTALSLAERDQDAATRACKVHLHLPLNALLLIFISLLISPIILSPTSGSSSILW